MRRKPFLRCAAVLAAVVLMVGCAKSAPKYRVDYGEQKYVFIDAEEYYEAGDEVRLKTYLVMDASPTVTADGRRLTPETEGYKYLVYTFTMPAHDVQVTYSLGGSDMMMQPVAITYEGDTGRLIDPVSGAYPGQTVTLKLGLVFDVSTEVLVNGEPAQQTDGPDSDYLYYAFVMPYEPAAVEIRSTNSSAVDPE
ncbi:MAG: hypothetical protein IJJ86_05745 [Clostridia bacterium]|nr:hypothetical protein [Clostridia bacterium]